MSLRALCLGDAHFQFNNTREVDEYLSKLKIYLTQHQNEIDIIVSMGDVLHRHAQLHVIPLNKAVSYFQLLSSFKPTYLIVGNHDMLNNSVFLTPDHWYNCLKLWPNITVIDNVKLEIISGCKVIFCPYVPDGRFVEALKNLKYFPEDEKFQEPWQEADVIFSHVSIRGANMGHAIAQDCDEWKAEYPFLITGHIHLSQTIGTNLYFTGSILQVAVDEPPNKHIVLATINHPKNVTIREHDLDLSRREILHTNLKEINTIQIPRNPNIKYTLYVHGEKEEFKAFMRGMKYKSLITDPQIDGGANGVKFKPLKSEAKPSQKRSNTNEKFKNFTQLLRESIESAKDESLMAFWNKLTNQSEQCDEIIIIRRGAVPTPSTPRSFN
jgi:DNA repair exonuclease SbcCD nuclease subunit